MLKTLPEIQKYAIYCILLIYCVVYTCTYSCVHSVTLT